VRAVNDVGEGDASVVVSSISSGQPSAVTNVATGYAAHVDEEQVMTLGATHVDEIQVITTTSRSIPEEQTVKITGKDGKKPEGSFTLTLEGVAVTISATASESEFENEVKTATKQTVAVHRSHFDGGSGTLYSITYAAE
jgi:ribosomal protein L6P/L9E